MEYIFILAIGIIIGYIVLNPDKRNKTKDYLKTIADSDSEEEGGEKDDAPPKSTKE